MSSFPTTPFCFRYTKKNIKLTKKIGYSKFCKIKEIYFFNSMVYLQMQMMAKLITKLHKTIGSTIFKSLRVTSVKEFYFLYLLHISQSRLNNVIYPPDNF